MKTVQILGMAENIKDIPFIPDAERWCSNNPRSYRLKFRSALDTWTRWFNLHTTYHIQRKYPSGYLWYQQQQKPIYLQEVDPRISSSIQFPRREIQDTFGGNSVGSPGRFFTGSVTWLLAFALLEKFDKIELWGFELKREHQFDFQRPGVFYWIQRAREMGIEVALQPSLEISAPGDPMTYAGPLYGYEPHSNKYRLTFGPLEKIKQE